MTSTPPGGPRPARHRGRPRRDQAGGIPGRLTSPALRLLIGVSVYREPVGRNAVLFQIGQADTSTVTALAAPAYLDQGPVPPFHAPSDLAELISQCEEAGLLVAHRFPAGPGTTGADIPPVFVDRQIASTLHRDLAAALRGDEIISAHQRAAEYWQWRAAAWPQDRHADLHDLLEARYHLHEAGDYDRAGALTEVVCAQMHAWGELDHEAALVQETLAWLPRHSPLRAAWIHEIGKIAQTRGNHVEAERRYRQSLEMFASLGDTAAASRSQHRLGILAQARGDYAEAEDHYRQAGSPAGLRAPGEAGQPSWPGAGPSGYAGPGSPGPESPGWPGAGIAGRPDGGSQPAAQPPGSGLAGSELAGRGLLGNGIQDRGIQDRGPSAASYPGGVTAEAPSRQAGQMTKAGRRHGVALCLVSSALATAAVMVGLAVAGVIRAVPVDGHGAAGVAAGGAAGSGSANAGVVRRQAAAWVGQQISRGAIVSCDPAMCAALRAQGVPAGNLLTLRPSALDPLGSDVVVATEAVRSLFGSRLAAVYAPAVVAAFGIAKAGIQVRVVAPYGATAYWGALRADLLARKTAGTELLLNREIDIAAAARKQLAAGLVDSRLLTTIAALAGQHALCIVGFADSGPGADPGTPLRVAEISAPGTATSVASTSPAPAGPGSGTPAPGTPASVTPTPVTPVSGPSASGTSASGSPAPAGPAPAGRASAGWTSASARFLRFVLAFLRAQRPPYLAANLRTVAISGGQRVVRIGFAGPSPLGLLTAGGASTDASP